MYYAIDAATKAAVTAAADSENCQSLATGCAEELCWVSSFGKKLLTLMITDLTLNRVLELGVPLVMMKINARKAETSETSNEAHRPDFDVAEGVVGGLLCVVL